MILLCNTQPALTAFIIATLLYIVILLASILFVYQSWYYRMKSKGTRRFVTIVMIVVPIFGIIAMWIATWIDARLIYPIDLSDED